ncbi:MAG: GHKL domain-containing protein [Saccharospirillaceae bacterium]|nr:HAMP domain-containing histidine kinase [Pseudomonadales bacterium]NRB78811.1 GHKL domain-containing protein [Saccharospirillaceae bacterium]
MKLIKKIFILSLYQRLALSLTAFVIILVSVLLCLSNNIQLQTKLKAEQNLHQNLARNLVNDNQHLSEGKFDYATLKDLFHTQMLLGPAFEFYFLDENGKILSYAVPKESVLLDSIDINPIKTLINQSQALPIFAQDPRSKNVTKIFSASAIYKNSELIGYLYIIIGGQQYDEVYSIFNDQNQFSNELYLLLGTIFALLIFLLVLFYFFTRPLNKIKKYADKIWLESPNFDLKNDINWSQDNNEIHQLGRSVNEMTRRLQNQYNQLQKIDIQRKTLLADLSHDLRTPLASLTGYLETLSIQTTLTDEQQTQFIQVALRNATVLTGLIDQLFELTYLEGGQIKLHKENINLTELLGDIVAKFHLIATQKNITFKFNATDHNLEIFTDIGKLERIFSNIIDNAIRHTQDNGEITLSISQKNNQCIVKVKDNGVGIAQEELSFIFDAHYQASNSENKSNKNVGLGLAITKNLVKLLDGEIEVDSQLGAGTEFTCYLAN